VRKLALMIFDTIVMTPESSIKIFDAVIAKIFEFAIMIFDSADMVFDAAVDMTFEFASMTFESADMFFDSIFDKKFDLFIVKKFDPGASRNSTPASQEL
jgi:hypothetical protein